MALEDCVAKRFAEIDKRADSEKKVVCFIADFVGSHYERVSEVFFPVIENAFRNKLEAFADDIKKRGYDVVREDFGENMFYFEAAKLIGKLYDMRRGGVSIFDDRPETPEIQLGLAEYFKYYKSEHFGKRLTRKGRGLAEAYAEVAKDI